MTSTTKSRFKMDDFILEIEEGANGQHYGTSPDDKGFLVVGQTRQEVIDKAPAAWLELVKAKGPDLEQNDVDEWIGKAFAVHMEITEHARKTGNLSGQISCSICGTGDRTYVVMPNGHVHTNCTTSGCVGFIQ